MKSNLHGLFGLGSFFEVDVKAGSVVWMKGHIHIGENIGDANTDVIIVELKEKTVKA